MFCDPGLTKLLAGMLAHSAPCDMNNEELRQASEFDATGAVKIIIQSAHIGDRHGRWKRPPSPFVAIRLNRTRAMTDAQTETYDPSWITQTFFLLVNSPQEELNLVLYDQHAYRKHGLLGAASFDISHLAESGFALDAHLPLLKEKKRRGDLLCSLWYYPISASPEDTTTPGRSISAQVRLGWDAPSIHVTPRRIVAQGAAAWEATHEFLCFDKPSCVLYIDVLDEGRVLGHVSICLTDLVEATLEGRRTWPLSGSAAGKLVASAQWKSLNLASEPSGSSIRRTDPEKSGDV
ncbi:hypothetical protein DFH07DRAFT_481272 [Mycena maculata]|uniref:C2 domain-containing protein n=1 Tax=Mycena maculata TaxID=230809 RepID=A0AAD7J3Z6_9AGAR|nr:hypothetical protein DFH07DRAFT_481272 [Mycena maculata]